MYYKLSSQQEDQLLHLPETGMGYQVVEASKSGIYTKERFLVLNSEIVIDLNGYESKHIKTIMNQGIYTTKADANLIVLNSISVLDENKFRSVLNESKNENERAAIENRVENANGEEVFVRLSAFENDRRVDKITKCLLPGSFSTTMGDYLSCKSSKSDPVERYALPNNDEIKFAFHIQPKQSDTLQRGIVQPANEKKGGGKEVYFENGTSKETFLKQEDY